MRRSALLFIVLAAPAACVPADEAIGLGSAQFNIRASVKAKSGFDTLERDASKWRITFDRIVLGFRTMTIGKVGDDDRCSFRGRGEKSDIVFDPRATLIQTFNGITPAACEDTGIFLSPPGDTTEVGPGVRSADLVELAAGGPGEASDPAHAIIDATAQSSDDDSGVTRTLRIHLRFDTARTSSRFGGCSAALQGKGVVVRANERSVSTVIFTPENLFQEGLGFNGRLHVAPFIEADRAADGDGVFTMDDGDRLSLALLRARGFGQGYQAPGGADADGSFGDYLRALFRFTFLFAESGTCIGNAPGEE